MSSAFRERLGSLREIFELLWVDASPFVRTRLALVLLLVMSASVLTAMGPLALKLVVDGLTGEGSRTFAPSWILIGAYVASQFLSRSIGELRGLVYARAERRVFRSLSERLFAHLLRLPLRFHLDRRTGAVSQTLENGLQGYQMILHHLVFSLLPVVAELGTMILVLYRLGLPYLLLMFCAALAAYAAAFACAAVAISAPAERASAAHVDSSATMIDGLMCVETVKYFNAESFVQGRVSRTLLRTETEWVSFYRRFAANGLGVAVVFGIFLGITVVYAAHAVRSRVITLGDFVLINAYVLQVVRPVEMLGYAVQGLSQGTALLAKLVELFQEPEERQVTVSATPRQAIAASGTSVNRQRPRIHAPPSRVEAVRLEFANVCLSYGPDRRVLQDVSFVIEPGRTLGIVGPSGCGKSSLVRLLVRLLDPDSGRVLLDDIPVSDLDLSELRRAVAVVPQDTVLFNDTIAHNIGLGEALATPVAIERAARVAHLHDFIMSLPDRYATAIGERGVKFSGGERQRIAIARAAIKRPRVLVFDEATSSLDTRSEREILREIREMSRQCTTVMIAHRLSTVVHADQIIVLDRGTIVEQGSHTTLLEQSGGYAGLWHSQREEPATA